MQCWLWASPPTGEAWCSGSTSILRTIPSVPPVLHVPNYSINRNHHQRRSILGRGFGSLVNDTTQFSWNSMCLSGLSKDTSYVLFTIFSRWLFAYFWIVCVFRHRDVSVTLQKPIRILLPSLSSWRIVLRIVGSVLFISSKFSLVRYSNNVVTLALKRYCFKYYKNSCRIDNY